MAKKSDKNHTPQRFIRAWISLRAENTQRQYTKILNEWSTWIDRPFGSIQSDDVRAWAKEQEGHDGYLGKVSKATVRRKLIILNKIYSHLERMRLIEYNPFGEVLEDYQKTRTGSKRPTKMIDFKLVKRLLSAPPEHSVTGARDRAFLALLFGGALRVSETAGLELRDIEFTQTGAQVFLRSTKNGEAVWQGIAPSCTEALTNYFRMRLSQGADARDPFLVKYRANGRIYGEKIDGRYLHRLFKRLCKEAGITGRYSPHSARKTAITKLLEDGIPLRAVAKFARHRTQQTTERFYDALRFENAVEVAGKLDF